MRPTPSPLRKWVSSNPQRPFFTSKGGQATILFLSAQEAAWWKCELAISSDRRCFLSIWSNDGTTAGFGVNETETVMNAPLILAQTSDNAAGVFFGLGVFGLILALLAGLFWIWMLVDALTNSRLEPPMRIVWAAIIFFLPFIGGLVYLFVGRSRKV